MIMTFNRSLVAMVNGYTSGEEVFVYECCGFVAFSSRFGLLRSHTDELWGAACAGACVSELRRVWLWNRLNWTSDEESRRIQPEGSFAIQLESFESVLSLRSDAAVSIQGRSRDRSARAVLDPPEQIQKFPDVDTWRNLVRRCHFWL